MCARWLKNNERGQSMLEAVIAIGIITTAISSALTLTQGSLKAEKESEASIIAGNLAREAMEVIHARRDTNWLKEVAWDTGFEGASFDYTAAPMFDPVLNKWTLDFSVNSLEDPQAVVYHQAQADGAAVFGLFRQAPTQPTAALPTQFTRVVTLSPLCDDGFGGYLPPLLSGSGCSGVPKVGILVTAQVRWVLSSGPRAITISHTMFDWR